MQHTSSSQPKAYYNKEFLFSPDARTIRILAEYLEPQRRLRKHKIRGTIVMFGSARALPPEDLAVEVLRTREQIEKAPPAEAQRLLRHISSMERMSAYYAEAAELARLLTLHFNGASDGRERHVICSGGGPGIMEAANRGAHEAGGKTVGFGISLPHEQTINRYIDPSLAFEFHYFFMRKYWFMYLARALIVFPGGFGTIDEFFEMLTLVQTRKVTKNLPIILYGSRYWEEVIRWDVMQDWGVISPEDVNLFKYCDTPEQAFEYLVKEIKPYGSETGATSPE